MNTRITISALLLVFTAITVSAGENEPLPSANAVVVAMLQHDAQRRTLATGYLGMRRYVLENERMHKQAELLAQRGIRIRRNQAFRGCRGRRVESGREARISQNARIRSRSFFTPGARQLRRSARRTTTSRSLGGM